MQRLRRMAGGCLDDDAVLLAMARHVLGGPHDEGRSSYQVSLSVCDACGGGAQRAAGELVPVDAAVVAMAACDAQHLGESLPLLPHAAALRAANENASLDAGATAGVEGGSHGAPAEMDRAPAAMNRDESSATRQSSEHAHVGAPRRRESDAGSDTISVASDTTPPKRAAGVDLRPSPRAQPSIPPALRRAVLTRDRGRCRVPGCCHATFVDVHHVQPRAEGGRHEASNLLTLCSAHHRAAHHGDLLIEREHEGGFTFRHADGAAYGHPPAPRLIDVHAKVFSALRHLGFREGEVKTVLAELRADAELGNATVERLLREALCRIRLAAR